MSERRDGENDRRRRGDGENDGDEPSSNGADMLVGGLTGLALVGAAYWLFSGSQRNESNRKISFESSSFLSGNPQTAISTISSEDDLKSYVKRNIRRILGAKGEPKLVKEEWPAPNDHTGKGDMVYHSDGVDYVIELKWIDYDGLNDSNRNRQTVKTNNSQKKKEVKEQAKRYGSAWLTKGRPYDVVAMAIINSVDHKEEILFQQNLSPRLRFQ